MNRFGDLRHLGLLPVLAWLLIQLAMSSGALSADLAGVSAQGEAGYTTVICTSKGIKTVTVLPDGSIEEGEQPIASGHGCKWCQSFGSIVFLTAPHANSLSAKRWENAGLTHSNDAPAPHNSSRTGFRSRAPPIEVTS